jgi:titin
MRRHGNEPGAVRGSNSTIGGTTAGARNVISGNVTSGVILFGRRTVVQGNYVGTNATGSAALGDQLRGVIVAGSNSVIGGTTAGARNVISGGNAFGVAVGSGAENVVVQGNYIGTDASGAQALGNRVAGVDLSTDAFTTLIGGSAPGAGNVISANAGFGILSRAPNPVIQGNLIGTNAAGTSALANTVGIELDYFGALVGGTAPGARNVISGNTQDGIAVFYFNNTIQGNYIGTARAFFLPRLRS